MKYENIAGLRLFYEPQEEEAARLIGKACEKSAQLLQKRWGLALPGDCRVYVMTSWTRFLFHSAPLPWKIYLALTFPLIARRAASIWPYAGGWALSHGRRQVVGVKPPRLIKTGDRSLGEKIFIQDRNVNEIVQTVTCHELTHAFTFHLKLPTWLHEGLATLAMEHYLGRPIVRQETLEYLAHLTPANSRSRREKLRVEDQQLLISQYARGYWLTRYIDETQPELLKELLSRRMDHKVLDGKLTTAFAKEREVFWQDIDNELRTFFN
jgi:hypothetical protein